jgi:MFS family permease
MPSKFAATLRHRDLRYVLGAYVVDDTASWGYSVVLAAYAYGRTGSTGWIALIACTRWIVGLVVSGYAGVLADRYDRARLIAASAVLCAIAMVGLTVVVGIDGPLWLLPALSALDTLLSSPVRAATGALVPDIVPEVDLISANGLFAILENVVVVVGPGIGGLLLLAGTPATAMGLNAVSYVIAAALYLQVRARSRGDAGSSEEGRIAQWSAGVRALARTRAAVLLTVFLGIGAAGYGAAIVVYAPLSISFGTGSDGYSYLLAASALGSVLAAFLAERLSALTRLAPLLVGAIVIEAVPFWLSDFVHNAVVGAVLQVLSGGGMVVLDVLAVTALQRDLPRAVLGRALAATGAVALGATVLGNLAASAVIAGAGLSWALALIGIGFPVVALVCLPALVGSDRATAEHTRSLQPLVDLLERLDLFDGANRRVLEQLAAGATLRTAAPGEVLMTQGDESDALWLLASGRLGVEADGVPLPPVPAPGYVGELGLMNNAPRSATVTVTEPAEIVRIEADDFREAVASAASSASMITLAGERLARTGRREASSASTAS